jgi:hypothetical protein
MKRGGAETAALAKIMQIKLTLCLAIGNR